MDFAHDGHPEHNRLIVFPVHIDSYVATLSNDFGRSSGTSLSAFFSNNLSLRLDYPRFYIYFAVSIA